MRLIKQISLELRQGTAEKVYEVDLCEVGADQFLVNFRYGPRGGVLQDGTKTSTPANRQTAEAIFARLVAEKTEQGYQDVSPLTAKLVDEPPGPSAPTRPDATTVGSRQLDPRRQVVLDRLAQGTNSRSNWKLSRAVWRAGELRLREAESLLVNLLGAGDAMLDYCIAWALGQLAGDAGREVLRRLEGDSRQPSTVRRIAAAGLIHALQGEERRRAIQECCQALPDSLSTLAAQGPAAELATALEAFLAAGNYQAYGVLEILYLIDNEHTRPVLLELLRSAPLEPNYFQRIRHIFKVAELRRDGEMFGLLAWRFETTTSTFRNPNAWYFRHTKQSPPTHGPEATKAFSVKTRSYFRRRSWWTLNRLGQLDDADYVRMAVGMLAPFTDDDAKPPRTGTRYDWDAYRRSNWRNLVSIQTHYDRYAGYWAFNHILYGQSRRYAPDSGRQFFSCLPPYQPGGAEPAEREEAYPQLWQRHPAPVLDLLQQSRCEVVHRFAIKVLRACPEFCGEINRDAVLAFLLASYEVTAEFGFELAVKRYDPAQPDSELILGMANSAYDRARRQAQQWIGEQKHKLLHDDRFIAGLIASPYADTRAFAREVMRQTMLTESEAQAVIGRLVALLQTLGADDGPLAADIAETMLRVFAGPLRRIGQEVIHDLLGSPLAEIQQLAGDLVLAHDTFSKQPPTDILQALLAAEHPTVRGIGVRIIGQLPDSVLRNSVELLVGLTRHLHADIRTAIRPTVQRLARSDREFGRRIASQLLDKLLVPGAPEGVPSHTALILREDLQEFLDRVPAETVWKLLQSRSGPAQEIGGLLLPTNVPTESLAAEDLVRLADHDILTVRESAWKLCAEQVERLRSDPATAVRLVETKWDDSRQFAFRLLREQFANADGLPPEILISICDSVRPEVQRFGCEMITRAFNDADGEAYVLKLSEHPSESMQRFASNFLEQHASDNLDQLRQLSPYFVAVLARVNRGRVSKDRAYQFLEREALKSAAAAEVVAAILARQSATIAVGDKAAALEIMTKIQAAYPSIDLPIRIQPVEVRGGV